MKIKNSTEGILTYKFSAIIFLVFGLSPGQTWALGSLGNYATANLSGITTSVAPSNVASHVTFSNLTRGSGLTPASASGAYNSSSWSQTPTLTTTSNTDYYQFTIIPDECFQFTPGSLIIGLQRSSTGPDKVELHSSIDNYATAIGAVITVSPTLTTYTFDLSALGSLSTPVTFRLFGYNASSALGTLRIQETNNTVGLEVNGTVSPYDVISPTITVCPSDTSVEGCSVENIISASLLPFSTSPTAIAYSQFAAEGGAATDNCTLNSSIQIKYTDVLSGSCPLNVIRTFTVSDASQNIASCTQNILIHDSTPPLISSGNLESCYPLAGDAETAAVTVTEATDNCSATLNYSVSTAGTCNAVVTVTVADACGNTSTTNYNTTIDGSAPTASNPESINVQCIFDLPAPDLLIVTDEADNCSTPEVAFAGDSNNGGLGSTSNPYIVTRTYSVTDACGNSTDVIQTLTAIDNENPIIGCPDSIVIYTDSGTCVTSGVILEDPITSDNCGGVIITNDAPNEYPVGTTSFTWTATDEVGNTAICTQSVTVISSAQEVCNGGVDDDCNGLADDADPNVTGQSTYYADSDGDGFGAGNPITACVQPLNTVENNSDCNDADATINPSTQEVCNGGIDDDCDGLNDDADPNVSGQSTYYADSDGDGFGEGNPITTCVQPPNTVTNNNDCNDADATVNPSAQEVCNGGIDNDCNGLADDADPNVTGQSTYYTDNDGDGFGSGSAIQACLQPNGTASLNGDCNDNNASIFPGAAEQCNTIDDDCDGQVDEDITLITFYQDLDQDDYGNPSLFVVSCVQPLGFVLNNSDCNDDSLNGGANVNPSQTEVCNTLDDDCDGLIDDSDPNVTGQDTYYADNDGDGFGAGNPIMACLQPENTAFNNGDCNDASSGVHPGAAEACNGIDDDCNGEVDENVNTPDATITPGGTVAACRGTTVTLSANSSPSYSYQWYKDGMAITGATNSTYNSTGTQHGYYTVVVTGVNGCVGTSDPTHVLRKPSPQATITVAIPSNNPDLCVNGRVKLHANGAQDLTYQWYHNNMLIAGATNQNYVARATGSYTVKILNTASGCSKFSEAVAVTNSCRLPELVTPTMNIYPNPASDKIEIQFTNGDKDEWLLIFYDLTGREILRKVCWDKEKITIPLYSFRDGLYFLQAFRNGNLFESQKVVIQKEH